MLATFDGRCHERNTALGEDPRARTNSSFTPCLSRDPLPTTASEATLHHPRRAGEASLSNRGSDDEPRATKNRAPGGKALC